jgi:TamB, inner membrane protein subunit of TAM complex
LKKQVSKVLKIARQILVGFLALLLFVIILIRVPKVQTWVVGRITNNLSDALQTEVSVDHVAIGFTGKLIFDNVLIRDQKGDTLFYVHQLKARLLKLDRDDHQVVLNGVSIDNALVNFRWRENSEAPNFQFFTDYFAVPAGSGGVDWIILFKDLSLTESNFRYKIDGFAPATDRDFDEKDFAFNQINGSFKDFYLVGDSLNLKIKNLTAFEKNGLRLKRLACKAVIHRKGMSYTDLWLETDNSNLEDEITFTYRGYPMLSNFVDSVHLNVSLDQSNISVKDLAYFSHTLNPYIGNTIEFKGHAKGYVRRFTVKNFDMSLGDNSVIRGSIDLTGLPDWRSCFTNLNLTEFRSVAEDIKRILAISELPDKLENFKDPIFSGHLTGFLTDFAADGVLASSLGTLRSRINFKLTEDDAPRYTGQLIAEDFDIGQFFNEASLGKTSFKFDLEEGYGLNFNQLQSSFESDIKYIDFNGLRLTNLFADGVYKDKSFDGTATLKDVNAKLIFEGKMDFNSELPSYIFTSNIEHLNLKALRLDSLSTTLSANLNIDLNGSTLDNLDGHAGLSDLKIVRGKYAVSMDTISINAGFDTSGRQINLSSDFLDIGVTGNYNLSYLDLVYKDILNTLFPDYYKAESEIPRNVVMNAEITIRENDQLGSLFQQNLAFGNGSFEGHYNSILKSLEVDGNMNQLVYDQYRFEKYYLNIRKKPHRLLNMSTDVKNLYVRDSLVTHDILLNASIQPNDIDFLLNFADTSDNLALRSYGVLNFTRDTISLKMNTSKIYSGGKTWNIVDNNQIWYTKGKSIVEMLTAKCVDQQISFSGNISESVKDRLKISVTDFDLDNLNKTLAMYDIKTGGVADGTISIYRTLGKPFVHANIDVFSLSYGKDTIGDIHVETESNDNPLLMSIEATVKEGMLKDVSFKGDIDLRTDEPNFDLEVEATNASVHPFEILFLDLASNFNGSFSAKARLYGSKKEHTLKGYVIANDIGLDVDYLNTRYIINDTISLDNSIINFNSVRVRDVEGNTGKLIGSIQHNLFDDIYLDLELVDIQKMICLNTSKEDNSAFYGSAFASGSASFKGYLDDITVDIKATSEKGTKITIPIYTESNNSIENYIRFKVPADTSIQKPSENIRNKSNGLTVKMAFKVTEDAELDLLFDEVLNDRITGSGTGNISMEYTSYEDFYMYGDFTISKGIYPFSSPTLVSEKFDIRKGGRIVWNGDPYNATIDLQAAVARNRAKPSDLLLGYITEEDKASYNTNIKMNVILNLKGDLFSPDITFDMEFSDNLYTGGLTQFNSLIKRVEADPDELNRQVFSLLTFGSFAPTANYGLLGAANENNTINDIVSSSVGSFLSNQVNNWISAYDQNWELGVNYKTRTGITDQEKAELIVSARRKLFDERLELAGSYSASSTGSINPFNVDLVYKVKKDGSLKLKAYHKLANDPTLGQVSNVSTTGVGFYFKKQFKKLRFRRKKEVVAD